MDRTGVLTQTRTIPGPNGASDISIRIHRPEQSSGFLPCLYFVHGGGMISGAAIQDDLMLVPGCRWQSRWPGSGVATASGAGLRLVNGKAANRQLYCMSNVGDIFFCDGRREANLLRFTDVLPGDEVHLDNHRFLAYCYYA